MLQALGLSKAHADAVLVHGLERGLFEVDPADSDILRTVPRPA
jgi:hypothetical protein